MTLLEPGFYTLNKIFTEDGDKNISKLDLNDLGFKVLIEFQGLGLGSVPTNEEKRRAYDLYNLETPKLDGSVGNEKPYKEMIETIDKYLSRI